MCIGMKTGMEHNDIPITHTTKSWYILCKKKKWANIVTKANGTISC